MKNSYLLAMLLITCSLLGAMLTIMFLKPKEQSACEYQFIVTDDSVTVFDSDRTVGTIKLEGQLDSLITLDNQ